MRDGVEPGVEFVTGVLKDRTAAFITESVREAVMMGSKVFWDSYGVWYGIREGEE